MASPDWLRHNGLQPTLAHLSPDSPRAADWQRIFGGLTVPILSPLPVRANGPGGEADFYLLDVDAVMAVDPTIMTRYVESMAARFGVPVDEVWADVDKDAAPIFADDVSVTFDARLVL